LLKTALQLKLGQSLTMTPQLQQAIRLLQMPAIELQAHVRELLESNVMLEQEEEDSDTQRFEALATTEMNAESGMVKPESQAVEVVDDSWGDQAVGPAENPWSGGGRSSPTRAARACTSTWPGSSNSPTCRRASWRSRAPSSMRSTTTAT